MPSFIFISPFAVKLSKVKKKKWSRTLFTHSLLMTITQKANHSANSQTEKHSVYTPSPLIIAVKSHVHPIKPILIVTTAEFSSDRGVWDFAGHILGSV